MQVSGQIIIFGIQGERKKAEGEGVGGRIPPVFLAQQQHMALVVCLQMHEKRQEHHQPAMFLWKQSDTWEV